MFPKNKNLNFRKIIYKFIFQEILAIDINIKQILI